MIWPVANPHITQTFGSRPEAYARFNLLGHNGLDFGCPTGTPVVAVDGGAVVEAANDPAGYGRYIKLRHDWGESLYAHLAHQLVKVDEPVASGTTIGLSGNSGHSTGPHLHFGIRVPPYFRDDGWGGFSDPLPHLTPREHPVLGPHLAGPRVGAMVDALGRWRPACALYLDPNPDHVRAIKHASPATKIIGRIYRPDAEVAERIQAGPADAARWMDGLVRGHPAFGLCDYWQIANEVCQVNWTAFGQLCATMQQWLLLAQEAYRCAIFGFSVGQPDLPAHDRLAYWRQTIPALEQAIVGDHILLIHQYGAPDLWGPDPAWYINRCEHQVLARLGYLDKERSQTARAKVPTLKAIKVVCGEYGIDGLIRGERKGWRSYTTPDGYAEQLRNMAAYVARWPQMAGYCLYTTGHASAEWADYDVWPEVIERLAQPATPQPPQPPQPPTGGTMTTKVYDLDGTERDLDWLARTYDGATVLPARLQDTDSAVWRLVAIYVTTGPAVAKAETRHAKGPVANQPVAFTYPNLTTPNADLPPLPAARNHWANRAVVQRTDASGLTGFGLGASFGPWYHLWVVSNAPSDCLARVGMKGGTNHTGPLHGVWALQAVEPAHATLADALLWQGERRQAIQFNPAAALQKRIFADGLVPNSPEFDVSYAGVSYVAQRAEHLQAGEVRIYYAPVTNYNQVAFVVRQ